MLIRAKDASHLDVKLGSELLFKPLQFNVRRSGVNCHRRFLNNFTGVLVFWYALSLDQLALAVMVGGGMLLAFGVSLWCLVRAQRLAYVCP